MTSVDPRAQAQAVRHAIASVATCSSSNVTTLDELLNSKVESISKQEKDLPPRTKYTKSISSSSKAKTTSTSKGKAKAKVTVLEVQAHDQPILTPAEKESLATEVINTALKALTEAIKSPSQLRRKSSSKDVNHLPRSASARSVLSKSASAPQQPLQPRSLNRVSSSPTQPHALRRTSSSASIGPPPGLHAIAECARLAFAYLRSLQSSTAKVVGIASLQLENGMSALVGRMIALGLEELAVRELRILKKRLLLHINKKTEGQGPNEKNGIQKRDTQSDKETLVSLLHFEQTDTTDCLLELVIAIQMHALKIILLTKRATTIEAASGYILLSSPTSPANLIAKLSSKLIPSGKVVRQLEVFSNLVLSFCPSIQSSDDQVALNKKLSVSPETAFAIQNLAFEVRILWWKLSGHHADPENDIFEPYARCFSAFARRATLNLRERYEIGVSRFETLKLKIDDSDLRLAESTNANDAVDSATQSIYQLLGSLAQDAGLVDEAIRWSEARIQRLNASGITDARYSAALCRHAVQVLRKYALGQEVNDTSRILSQALAGLKEGTKGDLAGIDGFLTESLAIRKAAMEILTKVMVCSTQRDTPAMSNVHHFSTLLVLASVQFLTRYVGTPPSASAEPKAIMQYDQRKHIIAPVSKSAIEAVLSLAKLLMTWNKVEWQTFDASLQDACMLASILDCKREDEKCSPTDGRADKYLPFVRISNMYWTYFLHLKQIANDNFNLEACQTLQRSVDSIIQRPRLEKSAGFLAIKLERLGGLYHSYHRDEQAEDSLARCILYYIEAGIMRVAAKAAATKSVQEIWEGDGELGLCGRALCTWTRSLMKTNSIESKLSNLMHETIKEAEERGILLEWHLFALSGMVATTANPEKYATTIQYLADTLFHLYNSVEFPLRRMRVVNQLIYLHSTHACLLDREKIYDVASECRHLGPILSGNDRGLQRYSAHLQSTLSVTLAFREELPPVTILNQAIEAWSSLLEQADSWAFVADRVDNVSHWISQLQLILSFFAMQGLERLRIPVLLILTRVYELQGTVTYQSELITSFSGLGVQYLRLGYSGKAGLSLAKARNRLQNVEVSHPVKMGYYLAYAEYFLEIGSYEKCEESLAAAGCLMKGDPEISKHIGPSATFCGRIMMNRLLAEASYICSALDLEKGFPNEALVHAKRAVSLNQRAWAISEHLLNKDARALKVGLTDPEVDNLTEGISALSTRSRQVPKVAPVMSTTHESLKGSRFWALVPSLYRALCQLSRLYSHQGMFQEVIHYNEQARKIARSAQAVFLTSKSMVEYGDSLVRGGNVTKGKEVLQEATTLYMNLEESKGTADLHCSLGYLYRLQSNWLDGLKSFERAEAVLDRLTGKPYINRLDRLPRSANGIEDRLTKLMLTDESPPERSAPSKSTKLPSLQAKKLLPPKAAKALAKGSCPIAEECPQLLRLRRDVLRQKAFAMILQQKLDLAASLLLEGDSASDTQQGLVRQRLLMAKHLLTHAIEEVAGDAVFCVLPESTISFPSIAANSKSKERQASEKSPGKMIRYSPQRNATATVVTQKKGARPRTPTREDFTEMLLRAREILVEAQSMAIQMCSISTVHQVSDLISSVTMLLSTASSMTVKTFIHPVSITFSLEIARILAYDRQAKSIKLEKVPKAGECSLNWPKCTDVAKTKGKPVAHILEYSRFQKDYIDIIPQTWTAISISTSESRDELFIAKFQAGNSPFILRLPLSRHNSRDADEQVFSLDQGKSELLELVELANFSAHQARDMTAKGAKAKWWAEREALDDRLKDLLANMENMWLGGFRGIFSRHTRRPALLSCFQHSFQNILERYLPSRQKAKKRTKSNRINLDPRILELFVGLGDATVDELDLEEPLTDLLYFVVDVLQFHGERNAYDEIDFDSIVVETHDALRCYHQSAKAVSSGDDSKQHTILLLDKSLHILPWESLPALSGSSVSRLPSLSCLRDRLLAQRIRSQVQMHGLDAYYINRGSGAYVLNPSGDLKSTQEKFEGPLASLGEWQAIVQRDPSENELKDALESRELLLYFGHGSGAQFIRARTIKKLDKCAVALLMGCSSGTLTEAGEYEPYGTPINYMHAGCPALVATLWDVTDKDIDRFSQTLLEQWGLLSPMASSSAQLKSQSRTKIRKKKEDTPLAAKGPTSIVEAVATARDSCILRYLNGAAPVVYGIPVYLS